MDEKQEVTQEVRELRMRRDQAKRDLDAELAAIGTAKNELIEVERQIALAHRSFEAEKRLVSEYKETRIENENVLDAQNEEILKNAKHIVDQVTRREELQSEISAFESGRDERERAERSRIATLMDAEFKERGEELITMQQEVARETSIRDDLRRYNAALSDENASLVAQNKSIGPEIFKKKADLKDIEAILEQKQKEERIADENIAAKTNEKTLLETRVKEFTEESAALTDEIANKKAEITELGVLIEGKRADYRAQETRLFAIAERETALNQREAFIKAKFVQAGVEYR